MKTNLFSAYNQWATRPADERYWTIQDLFEATREIQVNSTEHRVPVNTLRVGLHQSGVPMILGPNGGGSFFSHHGFGQLCRLTGAPADYLRSLPGDLAARNLHHGLESYQKNYPDRIVNILDVKNGHRTIRAVTSDLYARIWNADVVRWLHSLPTCWTVPPARPAGIVNEQTRIATEEDCLRFSRFSHSLAIKPGDEIAPAGLYASDHDMFCFLVDETKQIEVGNERLCRGFFIENNEVGSGSLKLTLFLYDAVCGNHIVWGAQRVTEWRIRHVGNAAYQSYTRARNEIITRCERDTSQDVALIKAAMSLRLGNNKDEVVDVLYGKKLLPRTTAEQAYDLAAQHAEDHGDPRTAWGMMSGITRLSQDSGHMDKRDALDRAGRKVLELAF